MRAHQVGISNITEGDRGGIEAELKIVGHFMTHSYEVQFGRTNLLYISNGEANDSLQ